MSSMNSIGSVKVVEHKASKSVKAGDENVWMVEVEMPGDYCLTRAQLESLLTSALSRSRLDQQWWPEIVEEVVSGMEKGKEPQEVK